MPAIISTLAGAAGAIGTGALMGAGGTAVAAGMSEDKKKKQKEKESLLAMKGEAGKAQKYAAGAPDRAKQAAKDEEARQRRIRALAGGQTLLSSDKPSGKTVLG